MPPKAGPVETKAVTLPVINDHEGQAALDIRSLRQDTGLVTYDPGLANTGACQSEITYVDGERGILRHRGYPIEELGEQCDFIEVSFLLTRGHLPDRAERDDYSRLLNEHSLLHSDMQRFFRSYPENAHPMSILAAMVVSLSSFYRIDLEEDPELHVDLTVTRLLSKMRTIAAFIYRQRIGADFVNPSRTQSYCANFLHMMFASPVNDYVPDEVAVRALNQLLILHADHGQNCSTSAVRLVGSSEANLYAAVAAGICALWGPRHGGANEAVIAMLEQIQSEGGRLEQVIEKAKSRDNPQRLMGFGHRIYKTYDPRARLARDICQSVLAAHGQSDPLLDLAIELEQRVLADDYFKERNLYPNVDFYSGLIFRALGVPTSMFTVMFALGRLPGWIAHWLEGHHDPLEKIGRPRQVYVGCGRRAVPPIDRRGGRTDAQQTEG